MLAVKRIVILYVALATYLLSVENCPTMLEEFIESTQRSLYLIFLQNQLQMFNAFIKELEKGNITAVEVKYITDALLVEAENRKS
jgi:mitochondrial fission protein ELM1